MKLRTKKLSKCDSDSDLVLSEDVEEYEDSDKKTVKKTNKKKDKKKQKEVATDKLNYDSSQSCEAITLEPCKVNKPDNVSHMQQLCLPCFVQTYALLV